MDKIIDKYFLKEFEDGNLFEKVVDQLTKDLYLSGLEASEVDCSSPITCVTSLNMFMLNCLRSDPEKLRGFLYRVDLREDEIVNWSEQMNQEDFSKKLALGDLYRELQKVLDRKKY